MLLVYENSTGKGNLTSQYAQVCARYTEHRERLPGDPIIML